MIYNILKGMIEGNRYENEDDFQRKIDILYSGNRINKVQHSNLKELLSAHPKDSAN